MKTGQRTPQGGQAGTQGQHAGAPRQTYYAHTATLPDGSPDPDTSHWQLLKDHLRNVADLARQFAAPLGLDKEAELAGLLHDLGKFSLRFQERLQDNSIHGVNHWSSGAFQALALGRTTAAMAKAGVEAPRSFGDYTATINREGLPQGVELLDLL